MQTRRNHRSDGLDRAPYLAAAMRHELGGALNAISILSSLLAEKAKRDPITPDEITSGMNRIGKQVIRATTIVDHYVEFVERVSASPKAASPDESMLGPHVARTLRAFQAAARRHGVEVSILNLREAPSMAIGARSLRHILDQLLSLLLSRPQAKCRVVVGVRDGEWVIEFAPVERALTADDLHVFAKEPGALEGSFIELAVIRRILAEAGGELAMEGKVMRVRVPSEG